ncbi:PH domain-containing protein [Pseudidiomarina aestuarii]|nr:PH domain-containing protein [Pseudidiomarina aestuarii]
MTIAWRHVEPAYQKQLQLLSLIDMVLISAIFLPIYYFNRTASWFDSLWIVGIIWTLVTLFFTFFWAPRRYRFTGYAETSEALHLRRGALWRNSRAVPLNRIQHAEVRQGLTDRFFGLGRVAVFTAGSGGADLSIPGLALAEAERIKAELMQTIAHEPEPIADVDEAQND